MAKELRKTCQKGLHLMVPGAYRLEEVKSHGRLYIARRCRQCQSDRVGRWNKDHPDRIKAYREKSNG